MTRKILNKSSPGSGTEFGADDVDYINALLTATDQGASDPVDINTLWGFRDQKLRFRSTGTGNPYYTIVNPAGTTARTITIPDLSGNDTFVVLAEAQTLTNKTLTTPVISSISNSGTITIPTGTDTLVGRATSDTLTNKTLTTPVISSISNTGTLTLPTATTTIVGRDTTDTLTNKTMDYNSNTFQNFPGGGMPYPDTKKIGAYMGGVGSTNAGLSGFVQGSTPASPTGTATWTYTQNGTDKKYVRFGTGAVAGNNNGHSFANVTAAQVSRALNIKFKCKFRCVDSTAVRYFIGFSEALTVPPNSTTPLANGDAGYALVYDVAIGSNFLLYRNDTTGNAPAALTVGAANANVHTIEFDISSANGARYSFDGGAFTSYETADVPNTTDPLYLSVWVTTTTTVAKSLDVWYWFMEIDA